MDSKLLDPELNEEPESPTAEEAAPEAETTDAAEVSRNAARKIRTQSNTLRQTDIALLDVIAENPEKAPGILAKIQADNPELAARIAKLNQSGDGKIMEKIKDPAVKDALNALSMQMETLKAQTDDQLNSSEKAVYSGWKKAYPELDPQTTEGKTPEAKRLRQSLSQALDTLSGTPVTEDSLEDALAIAKRRSNWQEPPVRKALDKQASQMAARSRLPTAPRGTGVDQDEVGADPEVARMFQHNADADRLKKVADAKKKAGFH